MKKENIMGRKCHCAWPECDSIRKGIVNSCDPDHLWAGPIIRFNFKVTDPSLMSIETFTTFRVIERLIMKQNDVPSKIPANLYIFPHHYPLAILNWVKL